MNNYTGLLQVWRYSVSHRLLLIRRNKDAHHAKRLELLFTNVSYIDLPTNMEGLIVRQLNKGEFREIAEKYQSLSEKCEIYQLSWGGGVGYVVCSGFFAHEDDLEYFHESAFESSFP